MIMRDAVVEGSGNFDLLGFFNVQPNLSTWAYNISASIGNTAATAGIRTHDKRPGWRSRPPSSTGSQLGLLPYAQLQNPFGLGYYLISRSTKLISALSPVMYLHWCLRAIERFEKYEVRLTWRNIFDSGTTLDNVSVGELCLLSLSAALVLVGLIWYLDNVVPWGYGVPKPFYFIFSTDYWSPYRKWNIRNMNYAQDKSYFEADPKNADAIVHLIDLSATNKATGDIKNIILTIYNKQITVILGPQDCGHVTLWILSLSADDKHSSRSHSRSPGRKPHSPSKKSAPAPTQQNLHRGPPGGAAKGNGGDQGFTQQASSLPVSWAEAVAPKSACTPPITQNVHYQAVIAENKQLKQRLDKYENKIMWLEKQLAQLMGATPKATVQASQNLTSHPSEKLRDNGHIQPQSTPPRDPVANIGTEQTATNLTLQQQLQLMQQHILQQTKAQMKQFFVEFQDLKRYVHESLDKETKRRRKQSQPRSQESDAKSMLTSDAESTPTSSHHGN
ncbi:hypothetical protein HPB51_026902 [Rhipicephalus microplus]|uniref:Uncharacterized protein n=1 Tax=Rhipicephalus microplus TaxID=6941 RepID=A0A9J6D1L7_RHIMP|nr:hypothetical protein HPB51_026902 [Rhipicephalus microplus]